MLIDSHCHLDLLPEDEHPAILARAREAGVSGMVSIGTSLGQAPGLVALARRLGVWCTVGVHPEQAGREGEVPTPEAIAALAAAPGVVGLGESGLDHHWPEGPPHDVQERSFRAHCRAAHLSGLPLVVHARDADADVARVLREEHARGAFRFVLHCFSSGPELARAGLELGGFLSFAGMLTFPKAEAVREAARAAPADRLLVETDSPYLAPAPRRGARNEPGFVAHTAARLAQERGLDPEALAALTTRNFHDLFPRAAA